MYPFYRRYAGPRGIEPLLGIYGGGMLLWDSPEGNQNRYRCYSRMGKCWFRAGWRNGKRSVRSSDKCVNSFLILEKVSG
jgi:hypothetical protein